MYPRKIRRRIETALTDTRVVLVTGPRQAGKTTLVKQIAGGDLPYFTLDNLTTLTAAQQDPIGFIRGLDRAVIDEVQRAPALMLAIKESVDNDPRPGRFLLTGSSDLMTLPRVADSLAGRMEVISLLPLSQSELLSTTSTFLEQIFSGEIPPIKHAVVADDLIDSVITGGYPEAIARKSPSRKQDWYLNYIDAIVQRDLHDIAQIEHSLLIPRLLQSLAHHSSQLVNHSKIGSVLDMNHTTTNKYIGILEQLYLIKKLPAWHSNRLKRLIKTPKLHFLDTGLLAALLGISKAKVKKDRRLFGALLETFVFSELLKDSSWSDMRCEFSHYRDKQQHEVDIVIQNRSGELVGIEVKASATVTGDDFTGLRKLAEAHKEKFVLGLVLYDDDKTVPFSDRLHAVPVSAVWN